MNETKLTPQVPAHGIYEEHRDKNTVTYTVPCSCTNPDDAITLTIERADDGLVTVEHTVTVKTDFWSGNSSHPTGNMFKDWYNTYIGAAVGYIRRCWRITYNVWVKGFAEYQCHTVMTEQQALNYAAALHHGVTELSGDPKPAPAVPKTPKAPAADTRRKARTPRAR